MFRRVISSTFNNFHLKVLALLIAIGMWWTVAHDTRATKVVVVRPLIVGQPAPGYHVEQAVVLPERAAIAGPREDLERIESVQTVEIDVTGLHGRKDYPVRLSSPDEKVRVVEPGPVRVTVTAEKNSFGAQ